MSDARLCQKINCKTCILVSLCYKSQLVTEVVSSASGLVGETGLQSKYNCRDQFCVLPCNSQSVPAA